MAGENGGSSDPASTLDLSGAAGPSGSATGPIASWPIYWGNSVAGQDASDRQVAKPNGKGQLVGGGTAVTRDVASGYLAWNDPSVLSDLDKRNLALTLYRAGLVSDPGNYDQVQAAWNQAVQDAAQAYQAGKMVTPMQMLASKVAFAADVRKANGGLTNTSTSTSYNIPSPQDSEAIVKSVFQQGIGRDPTEHELAKYSTMISGIAQKNPSTSTSTTTRDLAGNSHTTTSTHEKAPTQAGYQQAIMDGVQQNPEYGAYQAATTYYNATLAALASPVHI